jgi:hypothetical protein
MFRTYLIPILSTLSVLTLASALAAADALPLDTARIDALTGLKGALNQEEGVYKVTQPRVDVKVVIDGTPMPPFMDLTSWAAFTADPKGGAMVMGDLVLLPDEVAPVMDALFAHGLAVTALHNHFLFDQPQVLFMHIGGQDTADKLAAGVRAALDQVKQVRAQSPAAAKPTPHPPLPATSSIPTEALAAIIGAKAATKDGMAKFTIGRAVAMPCDCTVGKEMGVNTWAAFMGSAEVALVDGDFATGQGELQPVLHALRAGGITVVAIHSHMEGETPRLIFLHYWGIGTAQELAKTVRNALDAQARAVKDAGK